MSKILITGGNGYIARRMLQGLSSVHEIHIRSKHQLDLTDSRAVSEYFSKEQYDVVIHTAAVGGSRLKNEDSKVTDTNLRMYYNLLENKIKFKKLINFGSGAEIFMPETPYGISKKIIANSIRSTDNWYNLRLFAVFDEYELNTRFIKSNLIRYLKKEPIIIHSNRLMDFFYMKDLISLVEYYITTVDPPKELNCSYQDKHTLKNIASIINQIGFHRVPIKIKEIEKLNFYCGENNSFPIDIIGLEKGIRETYNALQKEEFKHEYSFFKN